MTHFEVVSKYKNSAIDLLPKRATEFAAGYDMVAAETILVPSCWKLMEKIKDINITKSNALNLDEVAAITKKYNIKPTLIPTGVKVYLAHNQYLKIVSRSSFPLKYWLICANGEGIIDFDYVDCDENEGAIFFSAINLLPFDIQVQAGERICQGIISDYQKTINDKPGVKVRKGGFGSTNK